VIIFSDRILALVEPLPEWLNFLAVGGAMLLVALVALIWVGYARRKPRRRRIRRQHKRHSEKRAANPTLAQTGGLPPVRDDDPTSGHTH
jgi:hypothetical protein